MYRRFFAVFPFVLLIILLPACDVVQDVINSASSTPARLQVGLILSVDRRISTRYGAELALAQINDEGGIFG